MSQSTTTSGYSTNVAAAFRPVGFGLLIAWQRVPNPNVTYFTIGTSRIAGGDIIKSSGSFVAFFDKYVYTDYSSYVMNWSVQRRLGQYPFGMIMAQADITLDNSSGLFLPGKDATIGSGILPNRPIKVSASIGNESINQFTGFTGQPELSINDRRLTLHAYDAMDYVAKSSMTTSGTTTSGIVTTTSGYLADVNASTIFQYILNYLGFSSNQYVLDQGLQSNYGYVSLVDRKFGDIINDVVIAEQALAFVDEGGIFKFWNRQHFVTTSGLGRQFALNYDNIVNLEYENTPIINDVIVKAKPRALKPSSRLYESSGSIQVPPNSAIDIFVNFNDDFGDMPVTSVTAPTYSATPSSTSYFSTNTKSDGTGTAASGQVVVAATYNFGKAYKITLRNPNSVEMFVTALVVYGTPAKVTSQIEQRYLDANSIEAYGRNPSNNGDPLIIENDYIQSSSAAYSLAYTLVNEYKLPRRRYRAEIFARPELQIGDWGSLTVPDNNNELRNVFVVGNQIQMDNESNLKQYLWLEERLIKQYFTIGSSAIAGTDEIAP